VITKRIVPRYTFFYSAGEFNWFFKKGGKEWGAKYGEKSKDNLFNARDIEKVTDRIDKPGRKRNHYFHEWKAAIALLKEYGFLSLVGQYSAKGAAHRNKVEIVRQRVSDDVWEAINKPVLNAGKAAGLPDLFVYHRENEKEWFFAEVKGPTDRIGNKQEAKSKLLDDAAGKCVSCLIELKRTTDPFTPPRNLRD